MVKLKRKIVMIDSSIEEKKIKVLPILGTILITIILLIIGYIIYKNIKPYMTAVKIDNVAGKKTFVTKCNNKDYIIIGKDKSYTMSLTNDNCEKNYYEGTVIIKENKILFNEQITGIIDNDYNILINNTIFKKDNNE